VGPRALATEREDEKARAPLPEEPEVEGGTLADELLDELMPPDLDWRRTVRRHPLPALLVAGAVGYWLGRSRRGALLAEGLLGALALGATRRIGELGLDEDPAP
jgi:hypothetical protein